MTEEVKAADEQADQVNISLQDILLISSANTSGY